jgi:hypothetical protein
LLRVEKEEIFFKDVKQHSNEAKNYSMVFHDILPKEKFYGILWEYEFGIKGMQTYYSKTSFLVQIKFITED